MIENITRVQLVKPLVFQNLRDSTNAKTIEITDKLKQLFQNFRDTINMKKMQISVPEGYRKIGIGLPVTGLANKNPAEILNRGGDINE